MTIAAYLEWLALAIGTVCTAMWALNKHQLMVSLLWICSSLLWILFAYFNGHHGLAARDILGLLIYAIGVGTYTKAYLQQKEKRDNTTIQPDTTVEQT